MRIKPAAPTIAPAMISRGFPITKPAIDAASPEYEFSEPRIADLLHDKSRLSEWMETVPDFEDYEAGSEAKKLKVPPT